MKKYKVTVDKETKFFSFKFFARIFARNEVRSGKSSALIENTDRLKFKKAKG